MGFLLEAVNRVLLALGDAVQWLGHEGFHVVELPFSWAGRVLNPILAPLFAWINVPVNAVATVVLAPIGALPGWLSNTIVSAVAGVLLLILFKHTSNQAAIGRVKDGIKADMLAIKLFRDELGVVLRSQGRVFGAALRLLRYSLRPLVVMIVPVSLLLAQMALYYQSRPLTPGETAIVTVTIGERLDAALPDASIESTPAVEATIGPVRVPGRHEIFWQIRAREKGLHGLLVRIGDETFEKELVVGSGFRRVSSVRPGWDWTAILLHPQERPFPRHSLVQSIAVDYPPRASWTSGTDWWLAYFVLASLVFAMLAKPFLKVRI